MQTITVYLPTRNRRASLEAAVNSVLNQTYPYVELVVVDDGSTDSTPAYLAQLSLAEPRLKVIHNSTSGGACRARNQAIAVASGDFITGLDDDDEFSPVHLETLMNFWTGAAQTENDLGFIYFQAKVTSGSTSWITSRPTRVTTDNFFDGNFVGNQVFAPRSHFVEAGLFDASMPAWQDLELFYRMLKRRPNARLLDLATYRMDDSPRPDRITNGRTETIRSACRLFFEKHGDNDPRKLQRLMLGHLFAEHYRVPLRMADILSILSLSGSLSAYRRLMHLLVRRLRHPLPR